MVVRGRWRRTPVLLATVAVLAAACGSSPARSPDVQPAAAAPATATASKAAASSSGAATTPVASTTTLATVRPNPALYAQSACRAFDSFAGILVGQAEDGEDASGEVGGMVDSASQAANFGGEAARWAKLVHDLTALDAVTHSAGWPDTTAATRLPQMAAVRSDCASIGAG